MKKNFLFSFLVIISIVSLAACGTKKEDKSSDSSNVDYADKIKENPLVTIEMNDGEKIEIELYPKVAPNTVSNFVSLVNKGFYDGLTFHRVIPDFMIQGGDPNGEGTGDPGYSIKGEFSSNGFDNGLKHERGILSMARSNDPDSAGSQFFIMVADQASLDGEYAAFGKVISGMDIVDTIVNVGRDENDKPLEDVIMKKVTVDTKGEEYPEPETNK
ncbi:peptidylprolyl isomerase [Niallia sp. NCCP-28]|uniref:peptidylprolyl isomerase n=1 Tax=Niallia sp. NCCP-28 TaxID=2934712 RepID=UPI00208D93C5|nr:peptidylprolyl isomerase [Niallia sp. NCCP-28]GKU83022.1 peptidyl-prolyl cis-trans isomerase [Niallia sp. NCCP-28]